jgi:hypothetical protein
MLRFLPVIADTTSALCVDKEARLGTLSGGRRVASRHASGAGRYLMLDATLTVLIACMGPTEVNRAALTGEWASVARGVVVELQIVESTKHHAVLGSYQSVDGTGSLTVLSTGKTTEFTATGWRYNPPNGVEISFFGDASGLSPEYYGGFLGDLSLAGALVGVLVRLPLATGSHVPASSPTWGRSP